MKNTILCNNCGHIGHLSIECQLPIISIGIILFKKTKDNDYEFLMIRRKDSFGYVDFLRGKYTFKNYFVIQNMINELTISEKEAVSSDNFSEIMSNLCKNKKLEESIVNKWKKLRDGFELDGKFINLKYLLENSTTSWGESEWGFPKGRRNYKERDYDCALREFSEETGLPNNTINNIENIIPYEEIFTGSNYKSYKHKYFLAYMPINNEKFLNYQKSEVSKVAWFDINTCLEYIRIYNLEKKDLIINVDYILKNYSLY